MICSGTNSGNPCLTSNSHTISGSENNGGQSHCSLGRRPWGRNISAFFKEGHLRIEAEKPERQAQRLVHEGLVLREGQPQQAGDDGRVPGVEVLLEHIVRLRWGWNGTLAKERWGNKDNAKFSFEK